MEAVLTLQLLPIATNAASCADSTLSCNSDTSCLSQTSCLSLMSDSPNVAA